MKRAFYQAEEKTNPALFEAAIMIAIFKAPAFAWWVAIEKIGTSLCRKQPVEKRC